MKQCNGHVCNCDHTRPSLEGNMVCATVQQPCVNCDRTRPSLEGNMVYATVQQTCASVIIQAICLALKEIIWCACATVQQPCVQLHVIIIQGLALKEILHGVCNSTQPCVHVCNCDHTRPSRELRKYAWCAQTVCKSTCNSATVHSSYKAAHIK